MIPTRFPLAFQPTPVEGLERLSRLLNGPKIFAKRDDQTGLAFGGNKARKLEYSVGEALEQGAKTLITVGAAQSNHCRQTAAAAVRAGLECVLVLSGNPDQLPSGNLLLDGLFGAELVWARIEDRAAVLQQSYDRLQADGRKPYLIPLGASNATGSLGYVRAFEELLQAGADYDWIVLASSSAGTQAGLVAGARLAGWKGRVLGISIDKKAADLQTDVARIANETAARLGERLSLRPEEIDVNDDYLGGGYGVLGDPEREAIRLFAKTEGILVDPVYTGRSAAGLIGLVRQGFFKPEERVLYWHTGGGPALFADRYQNEFSRR